MRSTRNWVLRGIVSLDANLEPIPPSKANPTCTYQWESQESRRSCCISAKHFRGTVRLQTPTPHKQLETNQTRKYTPVCTYRWESQESRRSCCISAEHFRGTVRPQTLTPRPIGSLRRSKQGNTHPPACHVIPYVR